jgi:hypothetical protein
MKDAVFSYCVLHSLGESSKIWIFLILIEWLAFSEVRQMNSRKKYTDYTQKSACNIKIRENVIVIHFYGAGD